ncbi:MAG: DUF116 domain-containing protein [Burkholderiales bacterium]|nr:DUF116 domain-containing protein [Burkholderiales bacterium]
MIDRRSPCPPGAPQAFVLDSGLRSGAENNALDRAWLRMHAAGLKPALLRFWRSHPSASIGAFQAIDRELRLEYCERRGIECVRRPSGGGALYLDAAQLGVSLVCPRPFVAAGAGLEAMLARFCRGIASGLRTLGADTRFKAPNDLEIDGRKLACTFASHDGGAVLLMAIVLLDADIRTMLEALRVPTEKLSADGLAAARHRLATLTEVLGFAPVYTAVRQALEAGLSTELALALEPAHEDILIGSIRAEDLAEESRIARGIAWPRDGALESLWRGRGSTLHCRGGVADGRFRDVRFAGDFHLAPPQAVSALEQAVAHAPLAAASERIEQVYRSYAIDSPGIGPADFAHALRALADQDALRAELGLSDAEASTLMLCGEAQPGAGERLRAAQVMLVPYCAKPVWCKWRTRDGCPECGLCAIGEAYRLGRSRGMQVTTVTNYEHLLQCLGRMREQGVKAYVGMCCGNFFRKRFHAFRDAGMDAVLLDIAGANCYELKQEDEAYAGRFQAQAKIDAGVLAKVIAPIAPVAEDRPASRRDERRGRRTPRS